MARTQLPPQIKKVTVTDRRTGEDVTRYQLTVDVGVPGGKRKQIRRRFVTLSDARAELAKVQGAVVNNTYVNASRQTVNDVVGDWLASKHRLKPSTLRGHKVSLQVVRDEYGTLRVQSLTKRHLDDLVVRLRAGEIEGRKKWSARSVNYMLSLMTAVLDDQLKQGNIARNVAALVDRVPGEAAEMKILSVEQMEMILDYQCRDRHLWTLALFGLRRGEISGLRWTNVDLDAKTVTISENRVAAGAEIVVGTPKSQRSRRTLPLPDDVITVLRTARDTQQAERAALGDAYGSGEYVACDEAGHPYHPNLITYRWGVVLRKLGIAHVRLHDARHSCASLLHARGVPIAVIAAWLGHASSAFTMARYTHAQNDALLVAAGAFRRSVTSGDTESDSGLRSELPDTA